MGEDVNIVSKPPFPASGLFLGSLDLESLMSCYRTADMSGTSNITDIKADLDGHNAIHHQHCLMLPDNHFMCKVAISVPM